MGLADTHDVSYDQSLKVDDTTHIIVYMTLAMQ